MKRIALAYSGGLDTTVLIHWLKKHENAEVVAVSVDCGRSGNLDTLRERALQSGAVEAIVVDAVAEFAQDFVAPALKANALYQGKYPLVSALSRPLIARHLVKVASSTGCSAVAHGCTGKGNDQVRFEVSIGALAPDLEILAPVRHWGMTRLDAINYANEHSLPITASKETPYSVDQNLWGRAIECGVLEGAMQEPPSDIWEISADPQSAPSAPGYLEVAFERGLPVAVDGASMSLQSIVSAVDEAAGAYGVGRIDMIEDRVVGIKSREVYEAPGAEVLIRAHQDLEELVLDRSLLRYKRRMETKYAELAYEGQWFSPLREAFDAFIAFSQERVSGTVRMRLSPGGARPVGRRSEYGLYDERLATYGENDEFDHTAAAGFIKLVGLPAKVWARKGPSGAD